MMFDLVLAALFGGFVIWLSAHHERERREWATERAALLERCVPGLTLTAPSEPQQTPRYGTDEWEWEVEQQRKGDQDA